MADVKISELTELAEAPATDDYFVIVDTSVGATKKIAKTYIAAAGANADITSLTGLTTALSVIQGGTGATTLAGANIVTASTNLTANTIVVGDDGAKGIKALALGAANLKLFMNAAGTANEYASGMKNGTFDYDTATASGTQAITGVGFKPSAVLFIAAVSGTTKFSIGFSCNLHHSLMNLGTADTMLPHSGYSLTLGNDISNYAGGAVSVWGSDGFTITWGKTGSPTGTATIFYMAFR